MKSFRVGGCLSASCIVLAVGISTLQAAFVSPMIGGGQVGMTIAPMKHSDIMFDGTNITLHVDETVATPMLRPLSSSDSFDPAQPWSALQNKAYNWQYAWTLSGVWSPPAGTAVWVERLHQDSGLEVFARPPGGWGTKPWPNPWPTLFAQDGDRWKWGGTMTHNAYAVLNPTQSVYTATYRVYIGDALTGVPDAAYGSADVTWTWNATPTPEPATLILLGCCAIYLSARRRSGR